MSTVSLVLIYIAVAVATFVLCRLLYKLIIWLKTKNIRIPKTVVRIFKLILLLIILALVGYFIYIGFQI